MSTAASDEPPTLRDLLAGALDAAAPDLAGRLETEPSARLDLIALALAAHSETDTLLRAAITAARSEGCTWDAIGRVLNLSRHAAQQRFGRDEPAPEPTVRRQVQLSPVTAFTEMGALVRAGRHGWHSIGYGTLFHTLEKDDVQWLHRRVHLGDIRAQLRAEGWQQIGGMTFPWAYFGLRTDEPALPDPEVGGRVVPDLGLSDFFVYG